MFADLVAGLWMAIVAAIVFAVIPAVALGRPARRRSWWPDVLAGVIWTVLAVIVLVPILSGLHLLNWATAMLTPLAWPIALWLYRYRSAPAGEFRALCRRSTLRVLTWMQELSTASTSASSVVKRFGSRSSIAAAAFVPLVLLWTTPGELRFSSPADYDVLAHARTMLAGGRWVLDPAASLGAVLSRLAMVDPMQALRFLQPLMAPGSIVAASVNMTSLNAACGWTATIAATLLALVAAGRVHRRDWWHVVAASAVAVFAFSATNRVAAEGGYVEYDAAPRQALRIARDFADRPWTIVAPPEQRVEVDQARRFMPLAEFVRRYGDRAGDRRFRFDMPGRDLFVFVEQSPLHVDPAAALTPARYAKAGATYWMPNARATLERRALEICERYRRTHARAGIYYEDATLRVYRFETLTPRP